MQSMRLRAVLLAIVVAGGACAPKAEDSSTAKADSTAPASAAADSTVADSAAASAPQRSDSLPTVTTQSKVIAPPARQDSIIGRDSAFGPIGTIDSKGKLVPIKKP